MFDYRLSDSIQNAKYIACNIQNALFYWLRVFELPLSFFHTLLVNSQNKIKIVTEINMVPKNYLTSKIEMTYEPKWRFCIFLSYY